MTVNADRKMGMTKYGRKIADDKMNKKMGMTRYG